MPILCKSIREEPVVARHPDWHVACTMDGFISHHNQLEPLQVAANAKITLLEEEGDQSHVLQPFDQRVAKEDKKTGRHLLALVQQAKKVVKIADQWTLVHIAIQMHKCTPPGAWIESFKMTNLHPDFRVPFRAWVEKRADYFTAGFQFKEEDTDKFALLPLWFQGMIPAERKKMIDIIEHHHADWSVALITKLQSAVHLKLDQMDKARVCYIVAKEDPFVLTRSCPASSSSSSFSSTGTTGMQQQNLHTQRLHRFQLRPPGLKGMALLEHMSRRAREEVAGTGARAKWLPSAYLNIEVSALQEDIFNPTAQDYASRALLNDAGGDGATLKLPQRRLNVLGSFGAHSMVANSEERMAEMTRTLQLAASMAQIKRVTDEAKKVKAATKAAAAMAAAQKKKRMREKQVLDQQKLLAEAPAAILRLARGASLKKREFQAIAEVWFPPLESPEPGQLQLPTNLKLAGMKARLNAFLETPKGQQCKESLPGRLAAAAAPRPPPPPAAAAPASHAAPVDSAAASSPAPRAAAPAVAVPSARKRRRENGRAAPTKKKKKRVVPPKKKKKPAVAKKKQPQRIGAGRRTSGRRPVPSRKVVENAARAAARSSKSLNLRKRKASGPAMVPRAARRGTKSAP